jgi:hypothetical protein
MQQTTGRYWVQVKNPDGVGWFDVAVRESWDAAEAFAGALLEAHGIEVRVAQLPTLTPEQLSEGDACEERR